MADELKPAANARQAHLLRFRGSVHPTGQPADYDGLFLTREEIEERARDIVGTPIWYEHEGTKKVGWVTDGSVDDKGRLVIEGVIDRNSFAGTEVAREIRKGSLKGLSLGKNFVTAEDTRTGIKKVISKQIEEVSITACPDLPDTDITEVAPDSETWDLTRQTVVNGLANRRTKTAINKKRSELLQLIHEARNYSDPLPQPNSVHTKGVDQSSETKKEEEERKGTMSAPSDPLPPTPAVPPTPAASEPPQNDLSELEMLKQKVAQQDESKRLLEVELAERKAQEEAWRENPQKLAQIVAEHNSKWQARQKEMAENEQSIIDRVTADMIAAGKDPEKNPEIFQAIKAGKEDPEKYDILYDYLDSTAGAASAKRETVLEAQYQTKNLEAERLVVEKVEMQKRLDTIDAANVKMEAQFKHQQDVEQRTAKYGVFVSGAADPRGAKRPRADDTPKQEEAAAATSADASADGQTAMFFGSTQEAGVSIRPISSFSPLLGASDPTSRGILDIFQQARGKVGMGRVDMKGIVGKDYGKPTEGVSSDGSIEQGRVDSSTAIRSSRPPVSFSFE